MRAVRRSYKVLRKVIRFAKYIQKSSFSLDSVARYNKPWISYVYENANDEEGSIALSKNNIFCDDTRRWSWQAWVTFQSRQQISFVRSSPARLLSIKRWFEYERVLRLYISLNFVKLHSRSNFDWILVSVYYLFIYVNVMWHWSHEWYDSYSFDFF